MSPTTRAGSRPGVWVLAAFQYLVGVLATLVCAPTAILFAVLGAERATYAPVRAWAWVLHAATGVRSRATGLEKVPAAGAYVVISSHTSHLDGPAVAHVLPHPVYFVIKRELARIPLWGHAAVKIGFIAVDRSDSERARLEMAHAVDSINAGRRVMVFAEGTRSPDGHLQAFKKGGFHLAVEAQVPILPVAVNGSHRLLPKGAPAVRPGRIEVAIGDPIPTAGLAKDDVPALLEKTRAVILALRRRDPDFVESA
ncbi:MAG TPA: lysophospholipid acyltransferase family protein [Thermoanaerobaculales bacterium]|nr:lysophospholipid acyltransferase family protein [Thermoanaerobaculales bacterium]HQL29006.1 lysophospholipid acyltransferase family protein [Thermoanaerobaculales bacterium]